MLVESLKIGQRKPAAGASIARNLKPNPPRASPIESKNTQCPGQTVRRDHFQAEQHQGRMAEKQVTVKSAGIALHDGHAGGIDGRDQRDQAHGLRVLSTSESLPRSGASSPQTAPLAAPGVRRRAPRSYLTLRGRATANRLFRSLK